MQGMTTVDVRRFGSAIQEGGWVVLGQLASILGALFLVRTLTESLGTSQYGELSLGLTIVSLVNQVVMAGVLATITRHYAVALDECNFESYRQAATGLMSRATTVVVAIGVVILVGLFTVRFYQHLMLAVGALIYALLSTYNSAFNGIQNAARRRASVAFHGALDAWLKIALACLVVRVLTPSSAVVVGGYVVAALVVLISQINQFQKTHPRQAVPPTDEHIAFWRARLRNFSMPFAIWGGFTWAQQVTDKWALVAFGTVDEVGRYAVLYQLGYSPVVIIGGSAILFLGPILFQRSGNVSDPTRNRSVHELGWQIGLASLLFTVVASGLAFFFHELIFRTFVAASFAQISGYLPWVVAAGGLFTSGQFFALKLYSELQSRRLILANTVSASLGVCMNVCGAWLYGMEGVIGALLGYSLIYFVWMAMLAAGRHEGVSR